jgi:1,4-alpha-glucan branching enzyme
MTLQRLPWRDANFLVPEVDDMVVYELHVGEFNETFDGVVAQLSRTSKASG